MLANRRSRWFVVWSVLAFLGAIVMYWPALDAPFFADDYVYLDSVNQLSFGEYLRASFDPRRPDDYLIVASDFWRPLYFLSFGLLEPIFGGEPARYHLVNLASHLSATVLIGLLGRRLTGRMESGAAAATVFAVHPAAFEAVAWISALNSISVPLALGAWLAFERATRTGQSVDAAWLAASVALMGVALGFRETAITFIVAIAVWHVLARSSSNWRSPGTWRPLLPFVLLAVAHHLVRTRLFTEPVSADGLYSLDSSHVASQTWEMLRYGFYPFEDAAGWRGLVGALGAVAVVAGVGLAALFRERLSAVVFLGYVAMMAPFVPLTFGLGPRYFYAASAMLALLVGVLAAAAFRWLERTGRSNAAHYAASLLLVGWLVFCVAIGQQRVAEWEDGGPTDIEAFVIALREEHATLPEGGTLYVANAPIDLVIFGAPNLLSTVRYYYPGIGATAVFAASDEAAVRARLGPNDRIFIFEP